MDMLGTTDYYALLEVPRTATAAEIAASYRRLARIKHPDKNRDNPNATVLFQELQSAYSVLKDVASRRDYDVKFNAVHVQQEQIRLFRQHKQKAAFTGVHTCNIKSWHQTSGFYTATSRKDPWMTDNVSSTKYPPSPPDKSAWPERPPPTDKKLEKEIRAARKDIVQKDKHVASLGKELKEKQTMISTLWQIANEVEHMKTKAQRKQAQIKAAHQEKVWHAALSRGQTEWNFPQLQSVAIVRPDGTTLFEDVPVVPYSAPVEPVPMDTDDADTLRGLDAALEKLDIKATQATADIESTTLEMRKIAAETQKVNDEKAKTEATLRELSRRWRIQHFGSGTGTDHGCASTENGTGAASENDDAASNDTGFDMWAAWGDDECGSDGVPEWPDHDVDPDWDHHQPYYDDIWSIQGQEDHCEEQWWPSWGTTKRETSANTKISVLVDVVDDGEKPVSGGKEDGGSSDAGDASDADQTLPANSSVSDNEQTEPKSNTTKESVWNAYKELSAMSTAKTTATASGTGLPTPRDTPVTGTLKSKSKPMSRPIDNVWAAKDGDLIDLGWGNEEETGEQNADSEKNGPAIGELPRRWYANGQAAHDALRHDSWNNDTWQRENCYEW